MPLIREVTIENFKSIRSLKVELGRINVLIGENGSGKSNVLEALVVACARARGRDEQADLAPRGVRCTQAGFMRSAFGAAGAPTPTKMAVKDELGATTLVETSFESLDRHLSLVPGNRPAPVPMPTLTDKEFVRFQAYLKSLLAPEEPDAKTVAAYVNAFRAALSMVGPGAPLTQLPDFRIFGPENTALRAFQVQGQLLPLGGTGEGLFAHLKTLSVEDPSLFLEVTEKLALLDWFEKLEIPADLAPEERSIRIRDRFLAPGALFDQRSANEGFLFLLFYFTLFISPETPSFFAVDNVDASLNPKLCRTLMKELVALAELHRKQVIFTTHNPSVLDGLNLADDEQRLFVLERGADGDTGIRRVAAPKPLPGEAAVKLSDAFLRGYLGGLPNNF